MSMLAKLAGGVDDEVHELAEELDIAVDDPLLAMVKRELGDGGILIALQLLADASGRLAKKASAEVKFH